MPTPRSSNTQTSTSRASARCCRPSSATSTSMLGVRCATAIAPRRRAGRPRPAAQRCGAGSARVRRRLAAASCAAVGHEHAAGVCRPWPRETTPGCNPAACSACTSAITVGVLPAPPATRLPTTSTGQGARQARRQPRRQGSGARPTSSAVERRRRAQRPRRGGPGRYQTRGQRALQARRAWPALSARRRRRLGGEGQPHQAGAARGVEHVDHRLVRRQRVGRDDDHASLRPPPAAAPARPSAVRRCGRRPASPSNAVAAVAGHRDDDLAGALDAASRRRPLGRVTCSSVKRE